VAGLGGGGFTATRYPIVLIHGFMGFKSLFGTIDYFPNIVQTLEAEGAQVFTVTASQCADSVVRGQQIIPQLEQIKATTGAAKLNLIGHSQGALDARYVAAVRPDLVASVTSVGGPHLGSPVAQTMLNFPLGFGTAGVQVLSDFLKLVSGSTNPNDAHAGLEALSPDGAAAFAAQFPQGMPTTNCGSGPPIVNGIHYYSWGGIAWVTNAADPLDAFWVTLGVGIPEPNDGLVGRCSSHLGMVIKDDYYQNHIDESNLMFGLVSPIGPSPPSLYREHANRLQLAGL
jgi:triacylglycerol lipase